MCLVSGPGSCAVGGFNGSCFLVVLQVSANWLLDMEQFNEWMNEEDYAVDSSGKSTQTSGGLIGKCLPGCCSWHTPCALLYDSLFAYASNGLLELLTCTATGMCSSDHGLRN